MEVAGLIVQENGTVRPRRQTAESSTTTTTTTLAPAIPTSKTATVATAFATPTEGVVQFHVSVKVDMKEFAGWEPERIASFFSGIAQVLAAKGNVEQSMSN